MLQKTRTRVQALPQGVRQFLKFATVGVMNTTIDWSLAFLLTYYTPLPRILGIGFVNLTGAPVRPEAAAVWCTKIISSGTATVNSFIWNRRWTFRIRDKRARARQFAKFVTVNVIGMLLNSRLRPCCCARFCPSRRVWRFWRAKRRRPPSYYFGTSSRISTGPFAARLGYL